MTSEAQSLITELDAAVSKASETWRSELLRRVTDLLLGGVDDYSAHQIAIFDDILCRLIENVEASALIELSARLAPLAAAPPKAVASLARNENPTISGPVLEISNLLGEQALIDLAMTKRNNQLTAIAARKRLPEALTDILVDRGNAEVALKLVANQDARLSERGFVKLIGQAKTDKTLAAAIATRKDMPPELEPFLKLTLA